NPLCRGRAHGARITASGRLRARLGLRDGWHRIRISGVTEYWIELPRQSALMLDARITLPHLPVSSAINLPKSRGESASTVPPRSARLTFMLGSARAALISLLSLSTISVGVFLGAPMPYQPLAS